MARQSPYQVTTELIENAIATARVMGENTRIASLVAGSVGRFAAEMDDDAGDALLAHALVCIQEQGVELVPGLYAALQALSAGRI